MAVSCVSAQHREGCSLTSINAVLSTRLYYFHGSHTEGPLLLWGDSLEDVSIGGNYSSIPGNLGWWWVHAAGNSAVMNSHTLFLVKNFHCDGLNEKCTQ